MISYVLVLLFCGLLIFAPRGCFFTSPGRLIGEGHQEPQQQLPQRVEEGAFPLVEDLPVLPLLLPLQAVEQHLPEPRDAGAHGLPHPQARLRVKGGGGFLDGVSSSLPVGRARAAVLAAKKKEKKEKKEKKIRKKKT